jgi:hypothetical protein
MFLTRTTSVSLRSVLQHRAQPAYHQKLVISLAISPGAWINSGGSIRGSKLSGRSLRKQSVESQSELGNLTSSAYCHEQAAENIDLELLFNSSREKDAKIPDVWRSTKLKHAIGLQYWSTTVTHRLDGNETEYLHSFVLTNHRRLDRNNLWLLNLFLFPSVHTQKHTHRLPFLTVLLSVRDRTLTSPSQTRAFLCSFCQKRRALRRSNCRSQSWFNSCCKLNMKSHLENDKQFLTAIQLRGMVGWSTCRS